MANWVQEILERNPDLSGRKIAKRSRTGIHFAGAGKNRTALIGGAAAHYYDGARRQWRELDTRLEADSQGILGSPGIPVRITLDGEVSLRDGGYRQQARMVGVFANGRFSELARFGEGRLLGDRVRRENGPYRHECILLPDGLREELKLEEFPRNVDGPGGALLAIESLMPGSQFEDGLIEEARLGNFHFRQGWAYDAEGNQVPVMRWAETRAGLQRVYSGVPIAWLEKASYPVVIDPDFSGDIGDTQIEGESPSSSHSHNSSSPMLNVGGKTFSGTLHVWRAYFKFDTTSIGEGSVVDQVRMRTRVAAVDSHVDWSVYVRQYDWSNKDPITSANRESVWDGLCTRDNVAVLGTHSDVADSYVTSGDLSNDWIEKSGFTYYGLWNDQEGYDYPNNEGGRHVYWSSDASEPTNRPLLIVEYSLATSLPLSIPGKLRVMDPQIARYETRIKLRASHRQASLKTRTGSQV